jgi:hypothetical protein
MHEIPAAVAARTSRKHILDMNRFIGKSGKLRFEEVRAALFAAVLLSAFWHFCNADMDPPAFQNTILLDIDTTLDSCMFPGFSAALAVHLKHELGTPEWIVRDWTNSPERPAPADSAAIVLVVKARTASGGPCSLYAIVMPLSARLSPAPDTQYRPLVDIAYTGQDSSAAALLAAKKIAENLRSRYVCRLAVMSVPAGAEVKSTTGLYGVCPAGWNVAFGIIDVTAREKGYLPKTVRLNLSESRNPDTATITLTKRMPYHSRAFWPAVSLCALSAVLYGCEYYYYSKYRRLGENDLKTNPDVFGSTFGTAQACEYGAGVSLGLGVALFCVTLFW